MQQALTVNPVKMASKGVKSVRSRVTNIAYHLPDLVSIDVFKKTLSETISEYWPNEPPGAYGRRKAIVTQRAVDKYNSWEWNYGQSPQYDLRHQARYPWGQFDIRLELRKGRIAVCKIYGDFFTVKEIETLEKALQGILYNQTEILKLLESLDLSAYIPEMDAQQWLKLIMGNESS